jgi:hypothetical protein
MAWRLIVMLLALTLAGMTSSPGSLVFAQDDDTEAPPPEMQSPSGDEQPPADAEQPTSATPDGGDPNVPWYQWHNDAPDGQFESLFVYQQIWALRTQTLENPNSESELQLRGIMDGVMLARELDYVHMLEAKGQAEMVRVEHDPAVIFYDGTQFVIYDTYVDRSYLVDVQTRQPVAGGPDVEPQTLKIGFWIRQVPNPNIPGRWNWKIVDSVRLVN